MRPVVIRMAAPAMCGRAIGAVTRPHVDRFDRSRRIVHPRRAVSRCVRASSSSSSNPWQGPPPGRLDETAARDRVMQLATGTPQGQGALEAVQGCVSVMPGMTNNRVMLFRYPGCKSPLDTVALNLVQPRWVVAFDVLANAPRRPGDPPFCFGVTHPALTAPAEKVPEGEDPIPPKRGDVGMVCQIEDIYHDNREERLYVTSKVVGRYRIDRVVSEHPFYVAETSQVVDSTPGDPEGERALHEAETRVWNLLKELDSLAVKTGEKNSRIDYDMRRTSPDPKERPPWDTDPPKEDERAEMFSWAVVRRLGFDERAHLDAARTEFTTARLAQCEEPLREGIAYLAAMAAVNGVADGKDGDRGGDGEEEEEEEEA